MRVKVSGVWKSNTQLNVLVGVTWKPVFRGYVRVAGTWRWFYGTPEISLVSLSGDQNTELRTATFKTTPGSILNTDWVSGGSGIDTTKLSETQYTFRATGSSGVQSSGVMRVNAVLGGKASYVDVAVLVRKA